MTQSLTDDQAQDIRVIALAGKSQIADHMVIATGRSTRQLGSMADKLRRRLKQAGVDNVRVEGRGPCHWILIDAGDVIVHLFRPDTRELYALEKLWDGFAEPHSSANSEPLSSSEPSSIGP